MTSSRLSSRRSAARSMTRTMLPPCSKTTDRWPVCCPPGALANRGHRQVVAKAAEDERLPSRRLDCSDMTPRMRPPKPAMTVSVQAEKGLLGYQANRTKGERGRDPRLPQLSTSTSTSLLTRSHSSSLNGTASVRSSSPWEATPQNGACSPGARCLRYSLRIVGEPRALLSEMHAGDAARSSTRGRYRYTLYNGYACVVLAGTSDSLQGERPVGRQDRA
jgi:hypothetical protein